MSESERIASALPKELRDSIEHIPVRRWRMPQRWLALVGYEYERLGLMSRSFILDRSCITPLGLEVREIIRSKQGD